MGRPFALELQMRVVALKDLTYSPDGLRIEAVAAGVEFDCPDGIVADYVAVGLIGPLGPPRSAEHYDFKTDSEEMEIDPARMTVVINDFRGDEAPPVQVEKAPNEDGGVTVTVTDPAAAAKADAAPRHPKAARKKTTD